MAENNKLFKGFKQILHAEGLSFDPGYLYFVRTSTGKTDGYLVLNGKKYGTAEEAKALIAATKAEILGDIEGKDPNTIAGLSVAINALADIVGSGFTGETDITKEVAALKATVSTLTGGDSSIDARIQSAITALNLSKTYEAKGAAESALTKANAYTDQAVSGATTRITVLEGKAHEHANADVLSGITAEKVSAWDSAEKNAKDYADGLAKNYDVAGAAESALTSAKAYADGLAKNYDVAGAAASALTSAQAYADGLAKNYDKAGAAASALTAAQAYADGLAKNYDAAGAAASALTAAKAYTDELANGAVKTNTEAIEKLNGTGEGSVSKQVADAIAEVVANAPENLDTLKEIADYIASDPQGVAELSNKVTALEKDSHTHANADVLSGITAEKVSAWDSAEKNAKDYADGLAKNYDAAGAAASALTSAKAYADGLASNYDAAGAAASALTAAQTYADGLNTAMDTRVKELEGDSHEHTNKAELDLIQSGDVAKWNAAYSALTIDGNDVD